MKLRLPQIQMPRFAKLPKFFPKRKLRAATRRATADDYVEEPTINLWKAFAVVLILHVVAVGGIYAFSSINAHQSSPVETAAQSQPQPVVKSESDDLNGVKVHKVKAGETLTKIASNYGVQTEMLEEMNGLKNAASLRPGQDLKIPVKQAVKPVANETRKTAEPKKTAELAAAASTAPAGPARDSGETYAVAKGDTPVSISKKLRVGYDDLLKLNKIDDPKKLRIGQKLKVPQKR